MGSIFSPNIHSIIASKSSILYEEFLLLTPLCHLKKLIKGTKKPVQTQIDKNFIINSVVNNWDIKTTRPIANVLIKYLQIKRNHKCSKMLSVLYSIINALYDLINAIRILFWIEEGKERYKLWAWTVSEQIHKKRGCWASSSSSRFIHKAMISGSACSYHGLELFPFFMSFIYTFQTYITSLSSESVTASWITTSHGIFCSLLSPASRLFSWNLTGYQPWCLFLSKPFGKQQQSCFKHQALQKPKIQLNQDMKCHEVWF